MESKEDSKKQVRLRGLLSTIGGPAFAMFAIAFWFYLGARSLDNPNDLFNTIFRIVLAPIVIGSTILAPFFFIAGIVQMISGKSNSIVEGFINVFKSKKKSPKS